MQNTSYRRLKVTNSKLSEKVTKLRGILGLNAIIAIVSIVGFIVTGTAYMNQVRTTAVLNKQLRGQNDTIVELRNINSTNQVTISELSESVATLTEENTAMQAAVEELEVLKSREELYNKYDFALERADGSRTDIAYEDIMVLEELREELGLGEDTVALLLAISKNESQGYADVKNKNSSAAGLCGLLSSTARYSYEELMGNGKGTYNVEYSYDPLLNLEMAMYYLAYLKDNTSSNYKLLVAYRGDDNDAKWFSAIERNTGKTIGALDI